jgi:hypothetical protein
MVNNNHDAVIDYRLRRFTCPACGNTVLHCVPSAAWYPGNTISYLCGNEVDGVTCRVRITMPIERNDEGASEAASLTESNEVLPADETPLRARDSVNRVLID